MIRYTLILICWGILAYQYGVYSQLNSYGGKLSGLQNKLTSYMIDARLNDQINTVITYPTPSIPVASCDQTDSSILIIGSASTLIPEWVNTYNPPGN